MGLSLNAEQKNLLKIFKIEEQYVIPEYQRPYSWEYEQCLQLYNDIMEEYLIIKTNEIPQEYFIGNLIIAKSDEKKDSLEVIDGQQRLTTLLIFIKVLSFFAIELKILKEIIERVDWTGKSNGFRINSEVFEAEDKKNLQTILNYTLEDLEQQYLNSVDQKGNFRPKKFDNHFERNIVYFYKWIKDFSCDNNIEQFVEYLLQKVYLLPIELTGKTQDDANEKALTIFETINNRGLNLEDADIFKAKLYKKAKKINEENL